MKEVLGQLKTMDIRFNRDSGYELTDCWIAPNNKLKGRALIGAPRTSIGHIYRALRNNLPKTLQATDATAPPEVSN